MKMDLSPEALLFTLAFVFVTMAVSVWRRLGLERDLLVGTVRAGVQLLAAGYLLLWVFRLETWWGVGLAVAAMTVVAATNASGRAGGAPLTFGVSLAAVGLAEIITVGLMLALGIIPATAQFLIPISGMVIGNAMITAGLTLNRLGAEIEARRDEILVWLSLGATSRQAAATVVKSAVKAGMIPSIDALRTVGLVQLPGMMTGQILAGVSPVEAVKYQILIMYSLTAAAAICAMVLGALSPGLFFTGADQLRQARALSRKT